MFNGLNNKQVSICQRNKLCVALRDWLLDFIQNDIMSLDNVKINVNPTNQRLLNNFNDYQWACLPDIRQLGALHFMKLCE